VNELNTTPTKILVIDGDDASFQVRQCIAQALGSLPIELMHARDATEALSLLERFCPDVIVIDDDEPGERDLFIDSLAFNHPPVVIETDNPNADVKTFSLEKQITEIPRGDSLEDIHKALLLVAAIGNKATATRVAEELH
jgi:chemotaxis response regulator CheB